MSIVDEILYLTKRYRDDYRQSPTVILINNATYNLLLDELKVDELSVLHGMNIEITNDVILDIQY
jgi:hypothetical protein